MAELKPCPFCGGEPKLYFCDGSGRYYDIGAAAFYGREMTHKLIRCSKCGVRTKAYLTDRGVFNGWNRRDTHGET
mgnify:FL=1